MPGHPLSSNVHLPETHTEMHTGKSTCCVRAFSDTVMGQMQPEEATMRLGLFLTTLIGLAGASHISGAADATWVAVGALENGVSRSCGGGSIELPEWTTAADGQVDIKGNTLTFTSTSRIPNHSFTVDLMGLQPDGSGRVVGKDSST
jgi:hypothetical protein